MKIVFFENIEHPGYYLIYKAKPGFTKTDEMYRRLTNTGEFENSGYPKINIKPGFVLELEVSENFFRFLADHISTGHISHSKYDSENYRAWYEFKKISKDEWLTNYYSLPQEPQKKGIAIQKALF